MDEASPMKKLLDTLPQAGRVEWIGVRPVRGAAMVELDTAEVSPEHGLAGDRYDGRPGSKRQVTLIQYEHLLVIAACLGGSHGRSANAAEKVLPVATNQVPQELGDALSGANTDPETGLLPGSFRESFPGVLPGVLRRNVVVSGMNLLALKGKTFRVGDAVLRWTGLCHPCSKMEAALGPGGYNAVRGHGGITASVEAAGRFTVGDGVAMAAVVDE